MMSAAYSACVWEQKAFEAAQVANVDVISNATRSRYAQHANVTLSEIYQGCLLLTPHQVRWPNPPPMVSPWLLLGNIIYRKAECRTHNITRMNPACPAFVVQPRTVRVDGLKFEYQLTEDDVRKVPIFEGTCS